MALHVTVDRGYAGDWVARAWWTFGVRPVPHHQVNAGQDAAWWRLDFVPLCTGPRGVSEDEAVRALRLRMRLVRWRALVVAP